MAKIEEEVLNVLKASQCNERLLVITRQLERGLYGRVNKVLEALGGKWNRSLKGHVFPKNAVEVLAEVIEQGTYRDKKKEDSFFETPADYARELVSLAKIRQGMSVLEPSAGRGAIVKELLREDSRVTAVEINPEFKQPLESLAEQAQGFGSLTVIIEDFLWWTEAAYFDRVVMNPPFSTDNKPSDVEHVLKAMGHLKLGGILVSVMSFGWTFRKDARSKEFRDFVSQHGWWYENPRETFKQSGTCVSTGTLVLSG